MSTHNQTNPNLTPHVPNSNNKVEFVLRTKSVVGIERLFLTSVSPPCPVIMEKLIKGMEVWRGRGKLGSASNAA